MHDGFPTEKLLGEPAGHRDSIPISERTRTRASLSVLRMGEGNGVVDRRKALQAVMMGATVVSAMQVQSVDLFGRVLVRTCMC